jgi:hypothetical protein
MCFPAVLHVNYSGLPVFMEKRQTPGRMVLGGMGSFPLRLLSKSITVTLPAVLLLLDIYPLRRLGGGMDGGARPPGLFIWEKLPFALLSVVAAAVRSYPHALIDDMASLERLGVLERLDGLSFMVYGFIFGRTVAPFKLSPLYELPSQAELWTLPFMLSYVVVYPGARVGAPSPAARSRNRRLAYTATLLPVLGIFHNGPADCR